MGICSLLTLKVLAMAGREGNIIVGKFEKKMIICVLGGKKSN